MTAAAAAIPSLPESAPFSPEQRAWVNGFLAGLFSGQPASEAAAAAPPPPQHGPLLFLWGSQTGSSEGLAKKFAKQAAEQGFAAKAVGLDAMSPSALPAAGRACIITSTYGDGDMPDNAQSFWDELRNGSAPDLSGLEFSVLALGDSNYVQFCEAGRLFDRRLEELGARRIHARADCDVDYEEPAAAWFQGLLAALGTTSPTTTTTQPPTTEPILYNKKNPFRAALKTNRLLNGPGSAKETRHFEILLEGSGLEYEVGDALGVMPTNCPEFVSEILGGAGLDGEEAVPGRDGQPVALREALRTVYDLTPFLAEAASSGTSAAELLAPLRKLQPRLYSISSSPKAHPGEVHLTVAIVRYERNGRARKGVCSTFLADRSTSGIPIFVHKSPAFRLPPDPAAGIIMVGPGTGIAPFRAFLEERQAVGAAGRNWLFFGDQHETCDFLYRDELEAWLAEGHLTRLDTAFSRDQDRKIYVQDRMLEAAGELWEWLQEGAYIYVCGDAKRMAKDVDAALHAVASGAGGLGPDGAAEFVHALKTQKRYLRDVY